LVATGFPTVENVALGAWLRLEEEVEILRILSEVDG
jgi:hypothetical protein